MAWDDYAEDVIGIPIGMGQAFGGGTDPFGYAGKGIQWGPEAVQGQYNPGLQQGTAIAGDYNLQGPGSAEQYYNAAANFYAQPNYGDQYWQQNQQKIQSGPQTSQNAQNFYGGWQDQSKGLDANMGAYYDRAKERSAADIDKSFGARGMFGSSAATAQLGQSSTDLEAQRARDEANYGLQRAAEQRAWSGLGGNLASAADQSNLANSGMNLGWIQGMGNLAQGFDANALAQVNSGMNAAQAAQAAREGRIQNMFQNTSQPGMAIFGMQNQYNPAMIQNDQALMDSSLLFGTGLAQDIVNADRYATEKDRADADMAAGLMGSFMGGMI